MKLHRFWFPSTELVALHFVPDFVPLHPLSRSLQSPASDLLLDGQPPLVPCCANIWDLDRAYETFEAITEKTGLMPDIHFFMKYAHLINRDPKAALAVIDEMVETGFTLPKEILKKVRRR